MENYRKVLITEDCMGGDGAIYLTDAPQEILKEATQKAMRNPKINFIQEVIKAGYDIECLLDSVVTVLFSEKAEAIGYDMVIEIEEEE